MTYFFKKEEDTIEKVFGLELTEPTEKYPVLVQSTGYACRVTRGDRLVHEEVLIALKQFSRTKHK